MEPDRKKPKLEILGSKLKPVLDDDLIEDVPTLEVFAGTIADRKLISKTILTLNEILPVPTLQHLKRVRNSQVVLCPVGNKSIEEVEDLLRSNSVIIEEIKVIKVASKAPLTRKQYDKAHVLWPCNFHANKYTESLVNGSLFSNNQIDKHLLYLRLALEIQGCVIVDPVIDSIVAIGTDMRNKHPTQHAALVAIDNVARSQQGGMWAMENCHDPSSPPVLKNGFVMNGIPKAFEDEHPGLRMGATPTLRKMDCTFTDLVSEKPSGPYLCTDYYVYLMKEPCAMCSMALVHSRAKRVFYANSNPERGALGSRCKLHTLKALNHHYEVFVPVQS